MPMPVGIENPVMPAAVALAKAGSSTVGAAVAVVVARVVARVVGDVTARAIVVFTLFTLLSIVVNGGASDRSEQQESVHPVWPLILVLSLAAGLFELEFELAATSELALELEPDPELLDDTASGQPPLVHCWGSSSVARVRLGPVAVVVALAAAAAAVDVVVVVAELLTSCGAGHGLS